MSIAATATECVIETFVMASPLGHLHVVLEDQRIVNLDYGVTNAITNRKLSSAAAKVKKQLEQYWSKPHAGFDLELDLHGTEFQRRVWRALQRIPAGQTCTYGQLAQGLRSSARAVGNACRQNPVPIIVPCHRVVASNGIGGFSGKTNGKPIDTKRWLLAHEGVTSL